MIEKIKQKQTHKNIIVGILTCILIFSVSEIFKIQGVDLENTHLILPVILLMFVPKLVSDWMLEEEKRKRIISMIGGLLFSFAYVTGGFLHYNNRLAATFGEFLYVLFLIIGFSVLTTPIMRIILNGYHKVSLWYLLKQKEEKKKYKTKTVFWVSWILIFLGWIPSFLTNWPGNFIADAPYQMAEVINLSYHTHHPLIHTYLMGFFYRWGCSIGNASFGFSFYTLLQMLILALSCATVVTYFHKRRAPRVVIIGMIAFYALLPVNTIMSITATKDILFAAFFVLFLMLLSMFVLEEKKFGVEKWIAFVVIGVLMTLFRNNAILALGLITPFIIISTKGKARKLKITISLAGIALGFILANFTLIQALNAYSSDPVKESFSVPLQQLGRVAAIRKDDLDIALYEEIQNYIPLTSIEAYNPYLSDAVKNSANENYLRDTMPEFLALWAKVGIKFPGEYVASFMANTMGFWYPGPLEYGIGNGASAYHMLIGSGEELVKVNYFPLYGQLNSYLFMEHNYTRIPILNLFFKPFFYFWMILIVILNCIYKRQKRNLIGIGFVITYFLSFFMGPFVALRYIYCMVIALPFILQVMYIKKEPLET